MSYETQTSDYGLDLAENTFSTELQSQTLEIENFELEPTQSNNGDSHELVFIGSTVRDAQTLIDNISGASEVIVLNDEQDELVQISEHLKDYQQLDAVHIVSHGESGQLSFGNATLNSDTLPEYEEMIEEWSLALDEEADLLLYGCDVALDETGNSFVEELSQITNADVSASVNDTGISGDWELETSIGEIEASSVFSEEIEDAYQHDLQDAELSISEGFGGGGGSSGSVDNGALDAFDDQVNNELSGGGSDGDDDSDGGDFSFPGDEAFDADFYLAQNPDVAEDGVDPLKHYVENGWKEGRDPNKVFDTSFYLEQNPDVAEAGINPLQHYYENAATDEITRYPNQDFRTIGTSNDAIIVASSDLSSTDIGAIKSFGEITQTENPEIAFGPATVPILYYTIAGGIAITAVGIELIRNSSTIEDFIRGSTTYTVSPDNGGIDTSIPPFDTGEIVIIEQESFPNGDRFIENILEGRFEFPDGDVLFTDNFLSINSGDSIFDDDSIWGDSDAINNPSVPDISAEAEKIANNIHSFPKHQDEFPGVETREDYGRLIDSIINTTTEKKLNLPDGRSAYWDDATGTIVFVDPASSEGGTAFKPKIGRKLFDDL